MKTLLTQDSQKIRLEDLEIEECFKLDGELYIKITEGYISNCLCFDTLEIKDLSKDRLVSIAEIQDDSIIKYKLV